MVGTIENFGRFAPGNNDGHRFGDDWPGQRCGAKGKRSGKPCRVAAMKNGRCYLHGGSSTGPRTPEGRKKISETHYKHGYYTKEAVQRRKDEAEKRRQARNDSKPIRRRTGRTAGPRDPDTGKFIADPNKRPSYIKFNIIRPSPQGPDG